MMNQTATALDPARALSLIIQVVSIAVLIVAVVYLWYVTPFRNGLRKQRKRDWDGAERDYTKMLQRNPGYWPARYNRALLRSQSGQLDGVLDELSQVIQRKPNLARAYILRGQIYASLNQSSQSAADYQKAVSLRAKPAETSAAHALLGLLNVNEAQRKSKDDPSRKILLEQAQTDADTALRLNKNENAFVCKAEVLKAQDDLQGAVRVYDEAFRLMPYSVTLLVSRSSIYVAQENYAAAIADCDKAIYLSGGNSMAYNNRGYARALQGDLDQALVDCNQALTLAPKNLYACNSRAFVYFLMDRRDEALEGFQQALQIASVNEYAMAGAAISLHALGRIDEAKAQWRALIKLNPEYRDADKLKHKYKSSPAYDEEAHKVAALVQE